MRKTCGDVDVTVDHLVLTKLVDYVWRAWCSRENAVLPSRVSASKWVTSCVNAQPLRRVQDLVYFGCAHIDEFCQAADADVVNCLR